MDFKALPQFNTKFRDELVPDVQKFLAVAEQQKSINQYCNLEKYKYWNTIFPKDPLSTSEANVISLISDDENLNDQLDAENPNLSSHLTEDHIKSSINDIACAIKENLETQHQLPENIMAHLSSCSEEHAQLFKLLGCTLKVEEIIAFGASIYNDNWTSAVLVTNFCRFLLVPMATQKFLAESCTLVHQFCMKYSTIVKREFVASFIYINESQSNTILQYLDELNGNFKAELLREFLRSVDKLQRNCFHIVEYLIGSESEPDTFARLVELMSAAAEDNSLDKDFGKLVMKVITSIGPNIIHHEESLAYIVGRHQSVWKGMMERTLSSCCEDNYALSQNFK